ncbi:hypothetical protein GCM10011575_03790 [Microlunatus endophyticus]|uniref:Uncharacterized protein n=1 Tax=Microlunatus endophyticus TaxID=1716077 RepID=A0A917S2N7_9ACTN|nr:hypothetical protein GCM10011575_03790 [Microlunatus endophyticus]
MRGVQHDGTDRIATADGSDRRRPVGNPDEHDRIRSLAADGSTDLLDELRLTGDRDRHLPRSGDQRRPAQGHQHQADGQGGCDRCEDGPADRRRIHVIRHDDS